MSSKGPRIMNESPQHERVPLKAGNKTATTVTGDRLARLRRLVEKKQITIAARELFIFEADPSVL